MESPSTNRPWVLLIDDHDDGRELMGEFLEFNGYEVAACGSGEEALRVVEKRGAPGVVITDLSLGMMSGTEVAQQLRERESTAAVPILAVTGHSTYQDEDRLFSAVLVKPVVLTDLAAVVERLIPRAS